MVFCWGVRGPTKKVTVEQKLGGGEDRSHVGIRGRRSRQREQPARPLKHGRWGWLVSLQETRLSELGTDAISPGPATGALGHGAAVHRPGEGSGTLSEC